MHGYRDHCMRTATAYTAQTFYCPYSMYQLICPFCGYRQRVEEYPAHHQKRPQGPPPNYIPKLPAAPPSSTGTIEAAVISPCTLKYTYLWLKNGQSFWSYIAYVGRKALSGWRYRNGRWVQFGQNLKQIKNFTCS